jgi:hypothetical protein
MLIKTTMYTVLPRSEYGNPKTGIIPLLAESKMATMKDAIHDTPANKAPSDPQWIAFEEDNWHTFSLKIST